MEKKKKYIKIGLIVFIIILIISFISITKKNNNTNIITDEDLSTIGQEDKDANNEIIEEKVSGYHLVTYAQTANSNSFINNIEVNSTDDTKIRFVIGNIDDNNFINERIEFTLICQKGNNAIDLLDERYILREGEYLFMDIFGQDVLYSQKGSESKSLVQTETKKVTGKMPVQETNYMLPFKYSLEKITDYNVLVLGNEITIGSENIGLGATKKELDYYHLTENRLQETFQHVNMSRVNISLWEKAETSIDKLDWIKNNLKISDLQKNDLIILQIGDNFINGNFEDDFSQLVVYLRNYSPNAQIFFVGIWTNKEEIFRSLPKICENKNIEFINIVDLNNEEYRTPVQEIIDGQNIEKYYPNNEAMQIISNRIIEKLGYNVY